MKNIKLFYLQVVLFCVGCVVGSGVQDPKIANLEKRVTQLERDVYKWQNIYEQGMKHFGDSLMFQSDSLIGVFIFKATYAPEKVYYYDTLKFYKVDTVALKTDTLIKTDTIYSMEYIIVDTCLK